jgi:hypothetical protein
MEDKNTFRKVLSRDEFYLSSLYYNNNEGYLYAGYYERVSFTNGTHLWYMKIEKSIELKLVTDIKQIENLNELYFNAVNEPPL